MSRVKVALVVAVALLVGVLVGPSASYALSYFSVTKTVTGTGTVTCPAGYRVTGGGADLLGYGEIHTSTLLNEFEIRTSHPTSNGWTASGRHIQGNFSDASGWTYSYFPSPPKVFAICVH